MIHLCRFIIPWQSNHQQNQRKLLENSLDRKNWFSWTTMHFSAMPYFTKKYEKICLENNTRWIKCTLNLNRVKIVGFLNHNGKFSVFNKKWTAGEEIEIEKENIREITYLFEGHHVFKEVVLSVMPSQFLNFESNSSYCSEGQMVYLKAYPYQAVEILNIGWERRGRYIKYMMPKYQVKFIYTDQFMEGYTLWLAEHELDITPNIFGDDDDDW